MVMDRVCLANSPPRKGEIGLGTERPVSFIPEYINDGSGGTTRIRLIAKLGDMQPATGGEFLVAD